MSGSLGTSPADTVVTVTSESLSAISNIPNSSSTAPSSVTSEPSTDSPSLKPLDDVPTPRLRVDSLSQSTASIIANVVANSHAKRSDTADKPLASREPVTSVPSDFPGKKVHFAVTVPAGGNFESDNHFYARCCMSSPTR